MLKKDQHMKYALECKTKDTLANIKLIYVSLPKVNIDEVDIKTKFCGLEFTYPFFINAMTGGSEKANVINRRLEYICKKLNIFFFSGSFSPALKDASYYYPKGQGINIGADKSVDEMKKAVEKTESKILQIHLNPIQEFMMLDGTTNFAKWNENIRQALENIAVPIILKETGFGMSKQTLEKLKTMGVKTVDISSQGGTNFAYIEDRRRKLKREYLYDLGYNLKQSLINAQEYMDDIEIIASGGIENPLQIVKCLAMGAKAVGISGYILKLLEQKNDDEIISIFKQWIYEIKAIIAITDSKNLEELKNKWEDMKC